MVPQGERKLRLLVVESDANYLCLLRRVLEENSRFPFVIDEAAHAEEAISKMRSQPYNLLLLEDRMNENRQLDVLRQIQGTASGFPIILMTDVRDDALAREALFHGVSELIIKSESQFNDLAARLEMSYQNFCRAHPDLVTNAERRSGASSERILETRRAINSVTPEVALCRDNLTGIYNHTYLHDCLTREFAAAQRYGHPLSCLFLDLDHFKTINEGLSFEKGDLILKKCAKILLDNCRMSDVVARYGGDKFVILLPHASYAGTLELADRIRQILMQYTFFPETVQAHATISIGASSFPEDDARQRFDLISFAEKAAMRSKLGGRNRITRYKDVISVYADDFPALKMSEDKIIGFQRRLSEISEMARRSYLDASRTLIQALEVKDKHTAGHSVVVSRDAREIAETMGMSPEDAEIVQHAALLHDIGKLSIPDELLQKKTKLTFPEYEAIKQHAYFGYKILKPIKFLHEEAILVLHHHEWFNGEGYPSKLKGSDIPLGARIIAVADTFDTLRASGVRYKKTISAQDAVRELVRCCGTQFDPVVVKAFAEILKKRGEISEEDYPRETLEKLVRESLTPPSSVQAPPA